MQPTYSPDGKFWWDGQRWQPVPGAPTPPPHRPSRLPLIIVGIVALVLVLITVPVIVFVFLTQSAGPTTTSSASADPSPAGPTLQPGEPVTKEKLSQVSAADFYWSALNRQLTEPASVVTSAYFGSPEEFQQRRLYEVKQVGVDHRTGTAAGTKQFTAEVTAYLNGKPDAQGRCVDGKYYLLLDAFESRKPAWHESDAEFCGLDDRSWELASSDGIAPNGLSAEQAAAMTGALRHDYPGFANPKQPELIKAAGKTYIRQIVDYKPYKHHDGQYWGTQIFLWALKKAGVDPVTWPWMPPLGPREGLHIAYYFDTKTLLPAASVMRSTPVLAPDGSVEERYDQTLIVNYRFPEKLTPLTLKDTKPLTLILPEGWKIPK